MSLLFIVRLLLSQTIDDSSYVYKWLPWSNPPPLCHRYLYYEYSQARQQMTHLSGCHGVTSLRHRYGYHGVTPTPMSSLFIVRCCHIPPTQQCLILIYGKLCCQSYKGHVLLAQMKSESKGHFGPETPISILLSMTLLFISGSLISCSFFWVVYIILDFS